jgi:hypothetical protein
MFYNSHPLADILKASTIYQYMNLIEDQNYDEDSAFEQ